MDSDRLVGIKRTELAYRDNREKVDKFMAAAAAIAGRLDATRFEPFGEHVHLSTLGASFVLRFIFNVESGEAVIDLQHVSSQEAAGNATAVEDVLRWSMDKLGNVNSQGLKALTVSDEEFPVQVIEAAHAHLAQHWKNVQPRG